MQPRRSVRLSSLRRRHEGLSSLEFNNIQMAMIQLARLLQAILAFPVGAARFVLIACASVLFNSIVRLSHIAQERLDPINPLNKNRLIESFSEEEFFFFDEQTSGLRYKKKRHVTKK